MIRALGRTVAGVGLTNRMGPATIPARVATSTPGMDAAIAA